MTDVITTKGKNVILNRAYLNSLDYTVPSKFRIGINNTEPIVSDTTLDYSVPIADGTTNDDGSNILTGSSGADNSTNNTTTFKLGAGNNDDTAQNLLADAVAPNVLKIWTIANLAAAGTLITGTQPFALWLYIKDAATLAKFQTVGTCLEIKLGSEIANYYSKTWTAADLVVGWNWITSNLVNVEDMAETGAVAGNIDTFIIEITTNNAADLFAAGDVIYDLLRQWALADLIQVFVSGYPIINEATNKVTLRGYLNTFKANGFLLNVAGLENTDTTPVLTDISDFNGISKSNTDELIFEFVNELT